MKNIWHQRYDVNTTLLTPQKKLGLFGLLNLLQDTAWIHATHLGHGYEDMIRDETAWVLTRQKLVMNHWPQWRDQIELITWIRPVTGMIAIRDFEIHLGGKKIGECSTQWLILDLKTRRPAEKSLKLSPAEFRQDAPPIVEASKISLQKDLKEFAQFHVRNSDLDLNGHVNNTRYAQWILDSLPEHKLREYRLEEYEVNFISETKSGDLITIYGGALAEDRFQFQGVRLSDSKTVFAAIMKVSAQQSSPLLNQK